MNEVTNYNGGSPMAITPDMKANTPVALAFQSREMIECLGMMQMAKMSPRDPVAVRERLEQAAKNEALAVAAEYIYVKGGTEVTGASIRAAEAMAKAYGNVDFGLREVSVSEKETVCQAYCWDMETNTRDSEHFTVPHSRSKGVWQNGIRVGTENQKITDQRELDEITRSRGSRIKRSCILAVIPIDVQEAFLDACEKTLSAKIDRMIAAKSKDGDGPADGSGIKNVIEQMLVALETKYGVTRMMVADRFQKKHNGNQDMATRALYNLDNRQVVQLFRILTGLKDNIATPADYFKGASDERMGTGPTGPTNPAAPHKTAKDSLKERLASVTGPVTHPSAAAGKTPAPVAATPTKAAKPAKQGELDIDDVM